MQHLFETAMACSPGSVAPPAHDSQDEPVQIAPTTMVAGETHYAARRAEIVKRSTNSKVPAEVFSSAAQPASPLGALPSFDQFFVLLQILHHGKTVLAASDAATSQAVPPVLPQQLQDLDRAMESRPPELPETPSLTAPSAATPLYNALLQKLNSAKDPKILEKLAGSTVFDKLLYTKPYGSDTSADQPGDLASRFEHLLRVTNEQRQLHIRRLASRQDPRDLNANTLIFHADDMMEILNEWRNDPKRWCDKLHAIDNLPTQQERHQARKKRFSTMLFHLMGDRAIPELFIKHPICGTDQPAAIISTFVNARQTWRNSEACKEARQISEKKKWRSPKKRPSQRNFLQRGKQKHAEEQW